MKTGLKTLLCGLLATFLTSFSVANAAIFTAQHGTGGTWNVYETVTSAATWNSARLDALTRTFYFHDNTYTGRLVSIKDVAENSYINSITGGDYWIGLTDNESLGGTEAGSNPNGGWAWVSGEPFVYQNFGVGEPNDYPSHTPPGEDAAHIRSDGLWNDHGAGSALGQIDHSLPYVVEYSLNSAVNPLSYWSHRLVDPPVTWGDNNQVDDVNEAEVILASPPGGSTTSLSTTNIVDGPNGISGFGGEDFALESTGYVDIVNGTSGTYNLYVNGDDGFRLRVNGVVVGEFVGPTGSSNTTMSNVFLKDGDFLQFTFFERGGGEYVRLRLNNDSGAFLGDLASGIEIYPYAVPEPTGIALATIGFVAFSAVRRRRK